MRERTDRATSWRTTAATLGAGGATALVLLSALAASGAGSPTLHGVTWIPSGSRYYSGCTHSSMAGPTFSPSTGVAHFGLAGYAHSCGTAHGGSATYSYTYLSAELQIMQPVALKSSSSGVSVGWSVSAGTRDAGITGTAACPTQHANYSYNYGYTWYNFSESYLDCYVVGSWSLASYTYVVDTTTGAYLYATGGGLSLGASSGQSTYWFYYTANYSNASYWAYNTTYTYAGNASYGGPSSSNSSTLSTSYVNGSFSSTDHYTLLSYLYGYAQATVYGGGASAGAAGRLNLQTSGHGATLGAPTVY